VNPDEFGRLAEIEERHWFYRGKRRIVRSWIERFVRLDRDSLLVDGGMGTGRWVSEMAGVCRVLGLDPHPSSLALAGQRVASSGGASVCASLARTPLADGCADVVTLLDVLEHMDDDAGALEEALRITRPGGLVVITVPALRWLWSSWDAALGHRRRYHLPDLRRLVHRPGVDVLHCAYTNTAALLPIAALRAWRSLVPARSDVRSEDIIPPRLLNAFLEWSLVAPAQRGVQSPVGAALLAVLRRVEA
jgi:SAM-dependent methyltransferase